MKVRVFENGKIPASKPADAAQQLRSAFAAHHIKITVVEDHVSTDLVGSILSVTVAGASPGTTGKIREINGECVNGDSGCVDGLVLPRHYSGRARVTLGVATTPKSANGRDVSMGHVVLRLHAVGR